MVITIFRHGRRAEIVDLKHQKEKGFITEKGREEIQESGRKFKLLVSSLLNQSHFDIKEMKFYISESPRTISSLLYRMESFIKDLSFENLPYQMQKKLLQSKYDADLDFHMFRGFVFCKAKIKKYMGNNSEYQSIVKEIYDNLKIFPNAKQLLVKYFTCDLFKNTNKSHFMKFLLIYDYLDIHSEDDLNKEEKELKRIFNKMNLYKRILDITNKENNVNIVFTNRILQEIVEEIERYKEGKSKRKIVLFSGHDFTLSAILRAIGVERGKFFYDFNDEIRFIIQKDRNNFIYIEIYYNDDIIYVPYCGYRCTFESFRSFIGKNINTKLNTIIDFCKFN